MFERSMDRFHHEYQYSEPRYIKIRCNSFDRLEKALVVIGLVEDLLNRPPEYEPVHYSFPNMRLVRDAVTAVLFNVYGNPTTLQLNAYRGLRLGNTNLGTDDVDIITQ
ncbi:hypothetical protein NEOLI_005185 [Neolecta irregularis DAH-3]|uniref:Uncharacterized protein n=1 Tax=Neolecta irregularis (strain DAH-3) TaxID=1198029 RepID=A0A1U7LJ70_NEOID|nr:hypothetical protein NEOLI_005185 [Neolecta irregularis DAH-3]|eukprot:OLL22697.1 hypothetical protein NEOLI_005185 [Neolecta irregularis DAH-3]